MLTHKKRKFFRIAVISIALALLIITTSVISAVNSSGFKNLVKPISIKSPTVSPVSLKDAADVTGFSKLTIADTSYKKVAETETLILYIENGLSGIKVYDKRSGYIWSSIPNGNEFSISTAPESFRNSMESMLTFKYVDLISKNSVEKLTYSNTEPKTVDSKIIKNGVRVSFDFNELNIKLSVDFTLDGDKLSVKVPDELVIENEKGVDTLQSTKADLTAKINTIRGVCEAVRKEVSHADYSESKRKIIELTANSVLETLITLDEQTGTGSFNSTSIDDLTSNIELLLSLTEDNASMNKQLKPLPPMIEVIGKAAEMMSQNRSTGITELQVIPYFGAQTSKTNGYVFYPDKNGAISYFNRKHPAMAGVYNQDVYASAYEANNFSQLNSNSSVNSEGDYKASPLMPVFGIKAGDSAFVAIIDKGDYDSAVIYNPCTADIDVGNINDLFYLRKKTTLINDNGAQNVIFDNLRTKSDRCTLYNFLNGENADYSGMAVAYREYLEGGKKLVRTTLMDKPMPLGLEFYMGTENSKQSLIREYVTMTRFSDIEKYLATLKKNGIDNIMVNITNWSERNGVKEPDTTAPASGIGGKNGLMSLTKYTNANGFLVGLSRQMVWAKRSDMSSSFIDIATVKNKSLLTFESNGYHMLNPSYIYNNFMKNELGAFKADKNNALEISSICNSLYFDYNKNAPYDRSKTAEVFGKLAGEIQSNIGYTIGKNTSAYMLKNMDWTMNVSSENSEFLFSDENVPFYQMVIHGSIPYTGDGFNLVYNKNEQMLKYIEYGYLPFYSLTEESPAKMRNNGFSDFYSGKASEWVNDITKTYAAFKKDFSDIYNKKIVKHIRMTDTVSKTVYENGTVVYVNYASRAVETEGIKINANSYMVKHS